MGVVEIVMPQLGASVAEGTLLAWRKLPGEPVAADEPVCDVASDKVDSEIPAPCAGRMGELLVAAGETVEVGTVIATMTTDAGSATEPAAQPAGEPARQPPPAPYEPAGRDTAVVARVAAELGVDLASVTGTGRGGRIRRQDVLAAAGASGERGSGAAASEPAGSREPYVPPPAGELSRMRRLIGEHMQRSLATAATVTQWIEVDFTAVEARRRRLGVTALPVLAAATVAALAEFGELNAWLEGARYTRHTDVNLGIAVSLGSGGLIVPVIRAAQRLCVEALAGRIADLATRARGGRLSPDEVRGATFTLTNPGQWGTVMATPVINQPEVAILDMEAIVRRPVVVTAADGREEVAIRSICVLGLSWDHRALDGAYAAQFLAALRARLEALDEGPG